MLLPVGLVLVGGEPDSAVAHQRPPTVAHRVWNLVPVGSTSLPIVDRKPAPDKQHRVVITRSTRQRVRTLSRTTRFDVPAAAVQAYRNAARVLKASQPSCHLTWGVLAAIGQVESNHGRYGGSTIGVDGVTSERIVGPALDGHHGVATIHDTDHGALDGDKAWDRAVGPMQFLPTTWASVGVDGDNNGVKNPNDIDDAALAAGVYLCTSGEDFQHPAQARAAILTYNHSAPYAALVLRLAKAYDNGTVPVIGIPDLTPIHITGAELRNPSSVDHSTARHPSHPRQVADRRPLHRRHRVAGTKRHATLPAVRPTDPPGSGSTGSDDPSDPSTGTGNPPGPGTTPAPSCPPETADLGASPSTGATDSAAPDAGSVPGSAAVPDPSSTQLTGTLATTADGGWCLGGKPLGLGAGTDLTIAQGDYDGDGTAGPVADELTALLNSRVTVTLDVDGLVTQINDISYVGVSIGQPGDGSPSESPTGSAPTTDTAPSTLDPQPTQPPATASAPTSPTATSPTR